MKKLRTAAIDTSLEILRKCNNQGFSVPALLGHQVKLEVQYQLQRAYEGKLINYKKIIEYAIILAC